MFRGRAVLNISKIKTLLIALVPNTIHFWLSEMSFENVKLRGIYLKDHRQEKEVTKGLKKQK